MSLTRDFVEYVVEGMTRQDSLVAKYANYAQTEALQMTDETFFATLLMQTRPFNETQLPQLNEEDGSLLLRPTTTDTPLQYATHVHRLYAMRYERMD